MGDASTIEAIFDPLISSWFREQFDSPTPIQAAAWPRIVAGEHVLISAPTGSGKTLTAFLVAIDRFIRGELQSGVTSVLYVSPLKALNNDIQRNLTGPLTELRQRAEGEGLDFPLIRVLTRSGDTPQSERRSMVRKPPEILITTPESLNLILSSSRARNILSDVRTVILDEIHAIVGSKRGTHLMSAVERLSTMAGNPQRIAISATVRPLGTVARFVGGYEPTGEFGPDTTFRAREVCVVEDHSRKQIELIVDFPDTSGELAPGAVDGLWPHLVRELKEIIAAHKSTLIFVSTRRHAEKITLLLNEGEAEPLAYSHHGSLSRELRGFVEESLKEGRLRAIVATNSLELGIDVGALDVVVMVKTPPAVSSTLQRVGRAGHQVGATSRGVLFPLYGRDMVEAAAMSTAALALEIEEVHPPAAPLDVLAQIVLSMVAMDPWHVDALFAAVRCATTYQELEREHFDLVLEMLAGRYAQTRIRDLNPRISIDRLTGIVTARDGATLLLYQSGGTIPDRGYYAMRSEGTGQVGELDEEFVWERRVGESFVFGSQTWTIERITDRDVFVRPAGPQVNAIPFWRAEARGRDAHVSRRILEFLEECDQALTAGRLEEYLAGYPHVQPRARDGIAGLLESQRASTGTPLPHRHQIVVEASMGAERRRADEEVQELLLHVGWGSRVNEPLAIAIAGLWERDHGYPIEYFADNDVIVLLLPANEPPESVLNPAMCSELLRTNAIEELLRERLEGSAHFGALFRENSGRALLLPRGGFRKRIPLWLNRLRSKKILAATAALPDFPILLETWRNCLRDEFDLPALREVLQEIATGQIRIAHARTTVPSPFASEVVWRQTNVHMYKDDSMDGGVRSSLSDDLIHQVAHSEAIRPRIPIELVEQLESRLKRTAPGYAPGGAAELHEWVTERLAIPRSELEELQAATIRDHGEDAWSIEGYEDRLRWVVTGDTALLASVDRLPAINALYPAARLERPGSPWFLPPALAPRSRARADHSDSPDVSGEQFDGTDALPEAVLAELLRFRGPRPESRLQADYAVDPVRWASLVAALTEDGALVAGELTEGAAETEVCDADNLEHLLRMLRTRDRPNFEPVGAGSLVPLWAGISMAWDGRGDPDALVEILDLLFGYSAPAQSWEGDILPARLGEYFPLWLDGLFADHELTWAGTGKERIAFALASETETCIPDPGPADCPLIEALERGPATEHELLERLNIHRSELTPRLWEAAWNGAVTSESFTALRHGILSKFEPVSQPESGRPRWPGRTGGRPRLRRPSPGGSWQRLVGDSDSDPIEEAERHREQARILIRRYGVVFREIVVREGGAFHWRAIFRALRLMELSGEVVSGLFVRGISAPQFASRSALERLADAATSTRVVWMSAVDPASPCGLGLGDLYEALPSRLSSNHLVFQGGELVMTSRRHGRELTFRVGHDSPVVDACIEPLLHLARRRWNPLPRVIVETVNEVPVRESPFAEVLRRHGFRDEFKSFVLSASYR